MKDNKVASPELYAAYKKRYPYSKLTQAHYKVIMNLLGNAIKKRLLAGERVTLGTFGTLAIVKKKVIRRIDEQGRMRAPKDWKASNDKRNQLSKEEVAERKHHVLRTNDYYFAPHWFGGFYTYAGEWKFKGASMSFERVIPQYEHILELHAKYIK